MMRPSIPIQLFNQAFFWVPGGENIKVHPKSESVSVLVSVSLFIKPSETRPLLANICLSNNFRHLGASRI